MGHSSTDGSLLLYEGRLVQINQDVKTATRWIKLFDEARSDTDEMCLKLQIFRMRGEQRRELKSECTISAETLLALERGEVEVGQNSPNRYIALTFAQEILRFQLHEDTCSTLYKIFCETINHSSWRIYKKGMPVHSKDLVLHLTSRYISYTTLHPLRLHSSWHMESIRCITYRDRTVTLTLFESDACSKSNFKEITLKSEQVAKKCSDDIKSRLAILRPQATNDYVCSESPPLAIPPTKPILFQSGSPKSERLHLQHAYSVIQGDGPEDSLTVQLPEPLFLSANNRHRYSPDLQPPPIPPRSPSSGSDTASQDEQGSSTSVKSLEPSKFNCCPSPPVQTTRPKRPAKLPISQHSPFKSETIEMYKNGEGETIETWNKFVVEFGVEDAVEYVNLKKSKSNPRSLRQDSICRPRANIIPTRPPSSSRQCVIDPLRSNESINKKPNLSLYSCLFLVWNSKDILVDTLGMTLKTWQEFVMYFDLTTTSEMQFNDWKALAERIGMTTIDIQVVDNYSIRFNQCASAIVMLYWQNNDRILKENYSREKLLGILEELEREDIRDIITMK